MTMKLRIAKVAWSIKIVFSIIISLGKSYNFVGTVSFPINRTDLD